MYVLVGFAYLCNMRNLLVYGFWALLWFGTCLHAQNKRSQVWAMSDHAGWDWSCFPPCVSGNFGMGNTYGTASICSPKGRLLCYSDGANVWNARHQVMDNGTGLYACPYGAQNSVFVPFNSDTNLMYLITADRYRDSLKTQTRPNFHCYAEDYPNYLKLHLHLIRLDGKGTLSIKNNPLYGRTDHISAVKHANNRDTWLFYLNFDTELYTALLLTDCGIVDTVESNLGLQAQKPYIFAESEIRFNNKGTAFIHSALGLGKTVYSQFDRYTGRATSGFEMDFGSLSFMFNITNDKLYVSSLNNLYEYIVANDSASFINSRLDLGFKNIWGMQIAGNKIIGTQLEYLLSTGSTRSPYAKVFTLNFVNSTMLLDSIVLDPPKNVQTHTVSRPPNYIQNYLDPDYREYSKSQVEIQHSRVCVGGTTQLKVRNLPPYTPYHWELYENGKAVGKFSNTDSLSHTFTHAGEHEARLVLEFSCQPDTIRQKLVTVDTIPQPNLGRDTALCRGETIPLYAPQRQVAYLWSNGNISDQITAGAGQYTVLVTNTCGSTSDTITIHEAHHELTNIVTPNEDQLNDHLVVNSQTSTLGGISIFNRWGAKVYERDRYANDWPYQNELPSSGTYFYEFKFGDCPSVKGWVEVR